MEAETLELRIGADVSIGWKAAIFVVGLQAVD